MRKLPSGRYDQRVAPVPQARELSAALLSVVRGGKPPAAVLDVHAPGEARVRVEPEPVTYTPIVAPVVVGPPLDVTAAYVELHTAFKLAADVAATLAIGEPVTEEQWSKLAGSCGLVRETAGAIVVSHHEWKSERGVVAPNVIAAQAVDGAAALVRHYLCDVLRPAVSS